jgi:hypothetical protein
MLQVPPIPPGLPSPEVVVSGGPTPALLLIAMVGAAAIMAIVFLGPVGRALADGLRHLFGAGRRGAETAELEAVREEMAALRHHVAELEERQDFAERLLAQARERGLLAGPPPTKE